MNKARAVSAALLLFLAALMAFAGTVSATTLTSPTGTVATPTVKVETDSLGAVLHPPEFAMNCQWSTEGTVESHGEGKRVVIPLSFTIKVCRSPTHGTVVAPGKFEIEWTSGYEGKVFWIGGTVEMKCCFGLNCSFASNPEAPYGTITSGSPAKIHLTGGTVIQHQGSGLCSVFKGPKSVTGTLLIGSPFSLFVDS